MNKLSAIDPVIANLINLELQRQEAHLELIASENYVSPAVLEAQGSILTNKYAEGYPTKRYYGGCEYVDELENIAIERAKILFKASYANVQPHSGSQANAAAYQALLEPNDLILAMKLDHGGHLSHGAKVSFSGKMYRALHYGVDLKTHLIDYNMVEDLALAHKPKLIVAGFSAYSRFIDWSIFRAIADKVGAFLMVDMAHVAGLVASGLYPSPIAYADIVTSTTHKTLRGPRGGLILSNNLELGKKINSAIFPGIQGGPLMHIIAAKAVSFLEAMQPEFTIYQRQVLSNASCLANALMAAGFSVLTAGTDNHLLLLDLTCQNISGQAAEEILGIANITTNKNTIPNDPRGPVVSSGLRLGTPAVTSRGFKEAEILQIAKFIIALLYKPDPALAAEIKSEVLALTKNFPVYC